MELWVILMAEGLVTMILLALGMIYMARRRRAREMAAIERFVSQLSDEEAQRAKLLEKVLLENCGIDHGVAAAVQQKVHGAERVLLQRVIQMFLKRDPEMLAEIDQLITGLSDPYCKLLAGSVSGTGAGFDAAKGAKIAEKVAGLERINRELAKQLETAKLTIDEISTEFIRVFGGYQTALESENKGKMTIFSGTVRPAEVSALELENTNKKMMQIFQDAENRMRKSIADLDA